MRDEGRGVKGRPKTHLRLALLFIPRPSSLIPPITGPLATAAKSDATGRWSEGIWPTREGPRHSARSELPIHDADEQFEGRHRSECARRCEREAFRVGRFAAQLSERAL